MGASRGQYTFMSHLRWTWAIALGYVASIALHMWLNAHVFGGTDRRAHATPRPTSKE